MQSILDDIYYGNYSRTFTPTPEYRKAVSAATKEWDAAKAVLGYERPSDGSGWTSSGGP